MLDLITPQTFWHAAILVIVGMVGLVKGGNWTIDGAVFIAKKFGVSSLIIGFTILAFGTSFPELLVCVNANLAGAPGISVGNIVGSNIANILFVLGVTSMFAIIHADPKAIRNDTIVMIVSTIIVALVILSDHVPLYIGLAMVAGFLAYVYWQYRMAQKGKITVEQVEDSAFQKMSTAVIFLLIGLASIAIGAELLIRGATKTAEIIGVPDAVIGLSVVAIGTSLPELSTCLIAALRKQTDLIVGNAIGSNIFNILMGLGVTATIKPIEKGKIDDQVAQIDIWVVLAVTLAFSTILFFYKKINRPIGAVFMMLYVLYIGGIYALYLTQDVPIPLTGSIDE